MTWPYLAGFARPVTLTHYRLRLAYEEQMMAAQGGRAGVIEMIPGGWLAGGRRLSDEERQIVKVNKSPATGRVVSVLVRDNHASMRNHWGNPFPDGVAKILSHTVEIERMSPDAYRAPTPEELAKFEAGEKAAKKARKASAPAPLPLINPTAADAERLQTAWNNAVQTKWAERKKAKPYDYTPDFVPSAVLHMTQAQYSANSVGAYRHACTYGVKAGGSLESGYERRRGTASALVCLVRRTSGGNYMADRLIVLTDKPQKAFPAAVWVAPVAIPTEAETVNA